VPKGVDFVFLPISEVGEYYAHVAAQHVNGVIAADRERIAVASDNPDIEVGAYKFYAGGHGRGAAVDRVKAVGIHVIREAAGAAYAGDDHEFLAGNPQVSENHLSRGQDGVITAARAPANFLVCLIILLGVNRQGIRGHAYSPRRSGALAQHFFDLAFDLRLLEGFALNLVQALRVNQELGSENHD
jgi:hypothetical protein